MSKIDNIKEFQKRAKEFSKEESRAITEYKTVAEAVIEAERAYFEYQEEMNFEKKLFIKRNYEDMKKRTPEHGLKFNKQFIFLENDLIYLYEKKNFLERRLRNKGIDTENI